MTAAFTMSNAFAQKAVEAANERKARIRAYDDAKNPDMVRHRIKRIDGLGLLHQAGEINLSQLDACKRYQQAFEIVTGQTGRRDSLDQTPRGDVDGAMAMILDAGKFVDAWQKHTATTLERFLLDQVVGYGRSIRSIGGVGRKHTQYTETLVMVITRATP